MDAAGRGRRSEQGKFRDQGKQGRWSGGGILGGGKTGRRA